MNKHSHILAIDRKCDSLRQVPGSNRDNTRDDDCNLLSSLYWKQTDADQQQKAPTSFLCELAKQTWLQVATACSLLDQGANSQTSLKAETKAPNNIWQIPANFNESNQKNGSKCNAINSNSAAINAVFVQLHFYYRPNYPRPRSTDLRIPELLIGYIFISRSKNSYHGTFISLYISSAMLD